MLRYKSSELGPTFPGAALLRGTMWRQVEGVLHAALKASKAQEKKPGKAQDAKAWKAQESKQWKAQEGDKARRPQEGKAKAQGGKKRGGKAVSEAPDRC